MMNCKVCLSKNTRLMDKKLVLYKCQNCTHEFSFPPVDENYKVEYFDEKHKNWFANPNTQLFDFILRNLKSSKNLMDVGCGDGAFMIYIKEKRKFPGEIYGTDIIDYNFPKYVNYIKGDFLTMRIGKKFDNIVSLATIEHLKDPHIYIKKIKEITNKDGRIVIMTFNSNGLMFKIARMLKSIGISTAYYRLYEAHHVNHFNNISLRKVLEDNGLKVIKHVNTNYPLKSVDVPGNNFVYKIAVFIIFKMSEINKTGIMQTIIAEKV